MRIKLLTLNIESAQNIHKGYWQYFTSIWKVFLPHSNKSIPIIGDFITQEKVDIATFTEIGGPSLQSRFKNQVDELAAQTGLPHTSFNRTIRIWKFLNQGNGVISKYPLTHREYYKLSSKRSPRYLECVVITVANLKINLLVTHLSLRKKYRVIELQQIASIIKTISGPIILCGDLNTESFDELYILERAKLKRVNYENTYPSWKPKRAIDHIFVSEEFTPLTIHIVPLKISDHLGLIAEFEIDVERFTNN